MSMIHKRLGIAVLSAALVVACSDLGGPGTDQATEEAILDLDILFYAADVTNDDIIFMTILADGVFGAAGQHQAGPFDGNVTFTREVTFFDDNGNVMDAYDPLLTASVQIVMSLEGSRSRTGQRGTMTMTISRSRDFTVSGLLGEETERAWNGTGSSAVNRVRTSDANGDREYDMSMSTTVTDVVIPVPRGSGWPISGTITRQITVQIVTGLDDTTTRERTVTIEFNGTQFVPITINGQTCTLDLALREVTCDATTG